MVSEIHKKAIEMWIRARYNNISSNPSEIIILHLLQHQPEFTHLPKDEVELCQVINDIKGLENLRENDKLAIQEFSD